MTVYQVWCNNIPTSHLVDMPIGSVNRDMLAKLLKINPDEIIGYEFIQPVTGCWRLQVETKTMLPVTTDDQPEGVERLVTAVEKVKAICDIVARLSGYALTHGESCHHKHRYNKAQLYRLVSARLDRAADELRAALDLLNHAEK